MKFQVELTYTIQDEPAIFKEISELCSRKVYIWATKRAYVESDSPLSVFTRASMMNEMVGPGYLEMWGESTDETCPPSNIDDEWVESYKTLTKGKVSLEWHPSVTQVRLVWFQTPETLQNKKILAVALEQIQELNLAPPSFPVLCL